MAELVAIAAVVVAASVLTTRAIYFAGFADGYVDGHTDATQMAHAVIEEMIRK